LTACLSVSIVVFHIGLRTERVVASLESSRINSAFEFVDWLRLFDKPLHPTEIERLVSIVERFHRSALREFFEDLNPVQTSIWDCGHLVSRLSELKKE
jgi:hypothetical protein